MEVRLSDAEKVFLIHGAEEGFRNDGRGCEDYRPIIIERGVLSTSDGSSRVRLDQTDLLIGVKLDLKNVDDTSAIENKINFFVDCSANASPQFAGKGGESFADDLVSALDAAYDNDVVLKDLDKLIVSPNHMWTIYVDIVILACGGSVIDAASIGIRAALSDLEICVLNTRPADAKKMTVELPDSGDTWKFDISSTPVIVSVNKVGTANVVDCTMNEETCVRSCLWVAVCAPPKETSPDDHCAVPLIRQSSGGSLERQSIEEMVELAVRVGRRLHKAFNNRLKEEDLVGKRAPGATFLE